MAHLTESDIRSLFRLDASEAQAHARCGPKAGCRVRALADVDQILDEYNDTLALRDVRPGVASPVTG